MANTRRCVRCETALSHVMVEDVEIDKCDSCGGLWLDAGEIRLLAEKQQAAAAGDAALQRTLERLSKGRASEGPVPPPAGETSRCPSCDGMLTFVVYEDTKLEQCHSCYGIFLDRGELDAAMEMVEDEEASTIMSLACSVYTSGEIGGG